MAALLSIVQFGLGQVYNGQPLRGLVWFVICLASIFAAMESLLWLPTSALRLAAFSFLTLVPLTWVGLDAIWEARRRHADYRLKRYNRWYVYVVLCLIGQFVAFPAFVLSLRSFFVGELSVPSVSMRETLLTGDHALIDKFVLRFRQPHRGEVVSLALPVDESIEDARRIIGLPGDTVEIRDRRAILNGQPLREPYVVLRGPTYAQNRNLAPVVIPPGHCFVLGDYRNADLDSRTWGPIDQSAIRGLVRTIYWSWDLYALEIRWERIGMAVE
ncbi:MAG TPA: signal peptidase I [Pirellulaceae bacterium]